MLVLPRGGKVREVISEAELRRLAARSRVDAMVQDLDYALGWFLVGLLRQPIALEHLIFKGGTCLRKCYFPEYRFSEDLDFTLRRNWEVAGLQRAIEQAQRWSQVNSGPDFVAAPARWEIISDEYGLESLQGRIYYRGPLRWGGPARVIQMDVTRGEKMVFPTESHQLIHTYSDGEALAGVELPCYSLAEMLAEKVRAIGGQRRFAVSRDLYDIYQLSRQGVTAATVRSALPAKFAAKGLDLESFNMDRLNERHQAMEADWDRRLVHLLPCDQLIAFDAAWQAVTGFIQEVLASPFPRAANEK
jgi:predicted nucleotidyltransferase component of viral defense system